MRTPHIIGVVILVAAAAAGGWFVGRGDAPAPAPSSTASVDDAPAEAPKDRLDWRARFEYEDKLAAFVEPGEGVWAPSFVFGLKIGASTVDDVKAWIAERKFICSDTSIRALMARHRDKKVAEIKAAQAAGDADGASGASWLFRSSEHEKNPQVRLTCERAELARIGDRPRPAGTFGRLMFIFDSPELPLRRVVIQRRETGEADAEMRIHFAAAEEAMRGIFGEPTEVKHAAPAEGESFVLVRPYRRLWQFPNLEAKVSALRLKGGLTIYEEVGVPWPVRADAPTLFDPSAEEIVDENPRPLRIEDIE